MVRKVERFFLMAAMASAVGLGAGQMAQASATVTLQEGSSGAYTFGGSNLTFAVGTTYYVEVFGGNTVVSTSDGILSGFFGYDYSVKFTTLTDTVTSNPTTAELLQSSSDVSKNNSSSPSITITISDTFTQPANSSVQLADTLSWSGFSEGHGDSDDSLSATGKYTGTNAPPTLTENSGALDPPTGPLPTGPVSSTSTNFTDGSSFTLTNALTLNLGGDNDTISTSNLVTLTANTVQTQATAPEPSTIALAISGFCTMGLVHLRRRRAVKAAV